MFTKQKVRLGKDERDLCLTSKLVSYLPIK